MVLVAILAPDLVVLNASTPQHPVKSARDVFVVFTLTLLLILVRHAIQHA